jgi:hypothetical protein
MVLMLEGVECRAKPPKFKNAIGAERPNVKPICRTV